MRARKSLHTVDYDVLMHTLKFNHNDLQANRDGRLTTKQQQYIRWEQSKLTVQVIAITVAAFLLIMVMIDIKGSMPLYAQWGCFAAMILPMALGLVWTQERIWWALKRGEVAMTQGAIILEVSDKQHYVNTPDKSFKISESVYDSLREGMTYQLYYLPEANYLLSAQPLAPMTNRPRTMQRRPDRIVQEEPEKQKRAEKRKREEKPKRDEKRKSAWDEVE